MDALKTLDLSDSLTQVVVAFVVIAGCTLIARQFDDPKGSAAAGGGAAAAPAQRVAGSMQVSIENLPNNPPRALAAALKVYLGLDATPVVVSPGVVRLGSKADVMRCKPGTTAMVFVRDEPSCHTVSATRHQSLRPPSAVLV